MRARRIQLEHTYHRNRIDGIDFDGSFRFVIPISERCVTREDALGRFLTHPLFDLLAQVFRIIPRHDEMDTVDELRLRFRVFRYDLPFLYEMDLDVEILDSHGVTQISVKPIGLLHQQDPARPVSLEVRHHLAKLLATGRLGRLHVLERVDDLKAVPLRILAQ